jgi:hypothetical protein
MKGRGREEFYHEGDKGARREDEEREGKGDGM